MRAASVAFHDETIAVELGDGQKITVPTSWYPRLLHADGRERVNYEIDDFGIVWPDVEADFSIRGLLAGRKSGESAESFKFWLENRRRGNRTTVLDFLAARRAAKAKVVSVGEAVSA